MATLVGTQLAMPDMLRALLELEYDAIAAYSVAIDRLDSLTFKLRFEQFRNDHQRHTVELSRWLQRFGVELPERADVKAILTQGKVVLGTLVGDKGILRAMRSNENDTNTAYERAVSRYDLLPELRAVLEQGLADEQRHRDWIQDQLSTQGESELSPASEEFVGHMEPPRSRQ